ncbi:hypothetical protein CHLRE_05g236525v5 [Chlamydomonas reinhardtii]|uniref:Uncharacterized protein n=1 Tax=Chlamydomonas reinhardtii TaxID=3055 RepID=A0A2K3DST9_CHLRE|nr:uncharacterized protein CHLRE_05g236525v5 [Chlamydomonas reinhardtii]PNW83603.1 hypothetical protein CHLRE_05g236525v5 [Chlamydomonas reinhardtii]
MAPSRTWLRLSAGSVAACSRSRWPLRCCCAAMPSCWEATNSDQQLLLSRHSKRSKESAKGPAYGGCGCGDVARAGTWRSRGKREWRCGQLRTRRLADATGGRREQSGAAAATT